MTVPSRLSSPRLRCFHPSTRARARLVCSPRTGGTASVDHRLSTELADEIEVRAAQYPGRHDRLSDPLVRTIPELADLLAGRLSTMDARGIAYCGHSMGATVAFEVARQTYTYVPGPPLTCPITALVGSDDPMVTGVRRRARPTTGAFRLVAFPGGHFYFQDHLSEMASLLREAL